MSRVTRRRLSAPRTYRVIQWSTGHVGRLAIRSMLEHPELELADVWVFSEDKDGKDAGELCGLELLGVRETRDVDALLALDADCVCYTPLELNPERVIDEVCRIPCLRKERGDDIEKGTVAAVYHRLEGISNGRCRVVADGYYRMGGPDQYPADWPRYRLTGQSEPEIRADLYVGGPAANGMDSVIAAAAHRTVNAIPAVCEAPSGIRTVVDLPHVTGNVRGLVAA